MMNNNLGRNEGWMGDSSMSRHSFWPIVIGAILLSTTVGTLVVLLMLHLMWPSMMLSLVALVGVRIALIAFRVNFARRCWSRNGW